ncbi:hypothetical protein GCM10020000_30830 [Streptomyces olivoverticillatus]
MGEFVIMLCSLRLVLPHMDKTVSSVFADERASAPGSRNGPEARAWHKTIIKKWAAGLPGGPARGQAGENLATYTSNGSIPTSARRMSIRSGSSQGQGRGAPSRTPAIWVP